MNETEMKELLNSSGIPFVYHIWRKPPDALPWGVFRFSDVSSFFADGVLYYSVKACEIELYTGEKDPEAERAVEDVLTAAGISFEKDEFYIEGEQLFEILYECEV